MLGAPCRQRNCKTNGRKNYGPKTLECHKILPVRREWRVVAEQVGHPVKRGTPVLRCRTCSIHTLSAIRRAGGINFAPFRTGPPDRTTAGEVYAPVRGAVGRSPVRAGLCHCVDAEPLARRVRVRAHIPVVGRSGRTAPSAQSERLAATCCCSALPRGSSPFAPLRSRSQFPAGGRQLGWDISRFV